MTGETHRAGGVLCSVVGFALLRNNGLLLPDVNQFVQLAVIYPYCYWASTASDLDHHWQSCPSKDIPSWCINKVLHLTSSVNKKMDKKMTESEKRKSIHYKLVSMFNAKHRSWQTHSDLTLLLMLYLLYSVMSGKFSGFGVVDIAILSLILTGVCLGIIAHFILDMLTPDGVWCLFFMTINKIISKLVHKNVHLLPEKIHFVPKMKCFATDSDWELFIRKLLKVLTVVSVLYVLFWIAFPDLIPSILNAFPYEITFK